MRGMGAVSSPQFAGRAEELQRLASALEQAGSQQAGGVLIGGESGIGKTRLVREFTTAATDSGARVLWGSAHSPAEGATAFAPIEEALRPLLREFSGPMLEWLVGNGRRELAMLLPDLADDQPTDEPPVTPRAQQRLFGRVREVLERLAGEQPVVLVVEDLHWADRSTRQLLSYLCHNLGAAAVLVVATYRTEHLSSGDPLRALLVELDHSGIVQRTELTPLTGEELRTLLGGVLGVSPSAAVCDEIAARSDGNPFFAEELLDAMRRGDAAGLPPTLRDLLLHRVELLDPVARDVLAVAAVVGRIVDHRLLAAIAGLDDDALLHALRQSIDQQLLLPRADGQSYSFRHALTHEAVYAALPAGDRLRLHAAVAHAMTERPELDGTGRAATLAHHWDAGGVERRALPARVAAGLGAERSYGFAEARQHFARAAELWRRIPDQPAVEGLDRVDLLDRAARAARVLGDHHGAADLLTEALADADPVRAAILRQRRGWVMLMGGDEAAGAEEIRRALESLPADAPASARAEVLAMTAAVCQAEDGLEAGRLRCEQAIALARQLDAPHIEAHARASLGPIFVLLGDYPRGLEELRIARRIAEEGGDLDALIRAYVNFAYAAATVGYYTEGIADSAEGLRHVDQGQFGRGKVAALAVNMAELLWHAGRWDEAEDECARALALDADGSAARGAYAAMALVAATRGRRNDVKRALAAARRIGGDDETADRAAAELSLWRGDPDAALTAVTPLLYDWDGPRPWPAPCVLGAMFWIAVRAQAGRVEAAAALRCGDDVVQAQSAASDLIARSRLIQTPLPSVRAYQALADAEWTRAQLQSDPALWATAAEHFSDLGDRYHSTYATWRQAEALADQDAAAATVAPPLQAAHAAASAMGAVPLQEALELLAIRTRISLAPSGARAGPPADGPMAALGLTVRESDVLRLVAEGLTNQEIGAALFISPKTASVHVTNILRKLDVPNRGQAAAVAHRLGMLTTAGDAADN